MGYGAPMAWLGAQAFRQVYRRPVVTAIMGQVFRRRHAVMVRQYAHLPQVAPAPTAWIIAGLYTSLG